MPDEESLAGGALASYGPSYFEMGKALGKMAEKILIGGARRKTCLLNSRIKLNSSSI